ncbi:MAG: MarR family transcriptional regulator, partial [Alicyclobacillus sp.]|nr:MarR family transcriptional regulator [Alicyclobacillus sp.]
DIAKRAGLSPGAVTQVCDELVRLGLVERVRSLDDRRVVQLHITEQGRSCLERVRRARGEQIAHVIDRLDPHDAREFLRILEQIVEVVESQTSE